jgi:predicted transcriptional regulator
MWLELLKSALTYEFGAKLKEVISKLGKTIIEFSEENKIPEGTLYKIISDEKRDFRRSTLIQIIDGVKKLEGYTDENFIGIITARAALDSLGKEFQIKKKEFLIKEYPATTIEEEIIQGIRAEKEGAKGLICGPIAATTIEKVVDIPISTLRFEEGPLLSAIKNLSRKI